jgi:serine/threonine protein phosphatase PrpC
MSTKQPDPTPPKAGGLWARLFGAAKPESNDQPASSPKAEADDAPLWTPSPLSDPDLLPVADPPDEAGWIDPVPVASAVTAAPADLELEPDPEAVQVETAPPPVDTPLDPCPACGTVPKFGQTYCDDCGWMFSNGPVRVAAAATAPRAAAATLHDAAVLSPPAIAAAPASISPKGNGMRIRERYEVVAQLAERGGVTRFSGLDHSANPARPIVIVQATLPEIPEAVLPLDDTQPLADGEEIVPTFEDPLPVAQIDTTASLPWPGVAWEHMLLTTADHPGLPKVIETFIEGDTEYLILEVPEGQGLWDAWDDPTADAGVRYGWLKQLAETLKALHAGGAICESLRPDIVTITPEGQAVLADLADLLPIPMPPGAAVRATLYTAPEVVLSPESADARADLYGFGALLYALEYLHHGLEEKDFEGPFIPKQITDRYPDVHPGFFRLICKTFCRELPGRFPTDEAVKEDKTGFAELIRTLEVCRRTFDSVRFDIAAWTTTGIIRTGNEDAFSFLHGMESRQDELTEYAMLLLCDGMGGYEAGEVAAAMALQAMRKYLLAQPIFSALAGADAPPPGTFTLDGCKRNLQAALKHANREVYTAARAPGKGRRGMGCTAECVYVDNRHVVVGHVGDSRTYHLSQGRMIQLTRDQTFVNRMVELGQLTEEEAEDHPRKNELQQAIGGQPDVEPGLYHGLLKRGDWVLVCSDGLTNHVSAKDLTTMLAREAMSAEDAARRLMNLVNLRGATDNATIVVIRIS